jgi:hypothetical protein
VTVQAPAPLLPFEYGQRLRVEKVEVNKDFALDGAAVDFELPNVGYGYGLLVKVAGNMVVSTATLVPKGGGIYNYLRRATLDFPGQVDLVRASGRTLKLLNLVEPMFLTRKGVGREPAAPNALLTNAHNDANNEDAALLTVGTNPWRLFYGIPMARNIRDLRGLRPLGHGGAKTRLVLQPSTEADFVTTPANADSSAIDVEVWLYYFDAPPPGVASPDQHGYTDWLTHIEEVRHDVTAVGRRELEVDPEGIILSMIADVWLNDAPNTADLDSVGLELDRRRVVDDLDADIFVKTANELADVQFPTGAVPFLFDQHASDPEPLDAMTRAARGREWLYSDEFNDVQPEIVIGSGATLGSVARIITGVQRLIRAR